MVKEELLGEPDSTKTFILYVLNCQKVTKKYIFHAKNCIPTEGHLKLPSEEIT